MLQLLQIRLKNCLSLLMEVADLVDEKRLYDRMRLPFYHIYDEAEDLITNRAQARDRGTELAAEIIADPDAMKLETFRATLVGAVNQVFAKQGYSVGSTAKEESLVNVLLDLAETYGSLNPTKATDNSSTPDFLDSLWRAQQTIDPRTPQALATIRAELERGIGALNSLLTGVQNKAQALKFVNNLLLAVTDVVSLDEGTITDARFLRELVAFGFQYAKLNPNTLTSATTNGTEAFLATLWQDTVKDSMAMRQATGKLDGLFAGLETKEEWLKLLKFETNLLRAIGQGGQELQVQKQNPLFSNALMELGSAYVALSPTTSSNNNPLKSFLDKVWQAQAMGDIEADIERFVSFLKDFENSEQVLRLGSNLFKAAKQLPELAQVGFFDIQPILPRVEPLNRGALYEIYNVFPGDTPRFMRHYYEGGGTPVDLADWGLLDTYRNAPDVRRGVYTLTTRAINKITSLSTETSTVTGDSDEFYESVNATWTIFAMGGSILELHFTATIDKTRPFDPNLASAPGFISYPYRAELRFSVNDEFIDVPDLLNKIPGNQELPGNPTPYPLTAAWSMTIEGMTTLEPYPTFTEVQ